MKMSSCDFYSATTLFNIWTKYAPRLPADYYNEKLLKVGDGLCDMKVSGCGVRGAGIRTLLTNYYLTVLFLFYILIFVLGKKPPQKQKHFNKAQYKKKKKKPTQKLKTKTKQKNKRKKGLLFIFVLEIVQG